MFPQDFWNVWIILRYCNDMSKVKEYITAAADLFFPRVCIACGEPLHTDGQLCADCSKDVPLTRFWKLRENPMAESFNELIQRNMGQNTKYQPYGYAAALFYYKGGFREITKSLKYRRGFRVGRHFARELGKKLKESPLFADVDLVVPVPLHWMRRWRRGYNQAEIIAREVAGVLGVPSDAKLLRRTRHTESQTHLDASGRVSNVSGAFRVRRFPLHSAASPGPRHILLVDDVFTTGATVAACERAIRDAVRGDTGEEVSKNKTETAARVGRHLRISVATLACVEK